MSRTTERAISTGTVDRTTPTGTPAVPFNRAYVTGAEQQHMTAVLASGLLEGDGPFTRRANSLIAEVIGAPAALLTTSCTHALEMSALLLDLAPGDEVIMPSFTFVSTATAVALRGAVPVFTDCRPDTLNLDERRIEAAITPRTRAIVVVHYAGVACDMDAITAIADRHGLTIVEDNAHGFGGRYKGRPLGSFGALATQSFHATKNVQCGEGGALVINDPRLVERAEIIREKGTNRSQFFRGMVDKYRWVENGSSYLPSELLAAFLVAQLEAMEDIQRRRHRIWASYDRRLADRVEERGIRRPLVPVGCEHPAHLYHLLLPDLASRQSFLRHLADRGVQAVFHYQPLHTSPGGLRYGRIAPGGCPTTENMADRIVRLPLFAAMSDAEVDTVVESVLSYDGPG
ncbi:dTDP-4-amino-4,6-dideoxygalactose transaminase [Actinoallomurus soli]|uniref:dTDP-4-amino-4,6-dideoxygalactose transaminase n=1 Tax=Actinoallomurus soli TaxID=2952535 RepID=UPI002093BE89|nr:dTDP-4-amino-4,6-dideoxygalactose transaminase [Actinoallomurus soli]MCO5973019.1 dTDP-4-amino-4,6-dideoxygalactose transaminase [Actinoallomurus soli]